MFSQAVTSPPKATISVPENISQATPQNPHATTRDAEKANVPVLTVLSPPETLPSQFSTNNSPVLYLKKKLGSPVVIPTLKAQLAAPVVLSGTATKSANLPQINQVTVDKPALDAHNNQVPISKPSDHYLAETKNLLLGVFIGGKEVGSLDVLREGNTLLLPLLDFAQIAGFTVETVGDKTQLKTPAGSVTLTSDQVRKINGITYVSDSILREKLATNVDFSTSDLALNVDLPWRRNSGTSRKAIDLQPEVRPPGSSLSTLRQELQLTNNAGSSNWLSSTILGGRLAGGVWRLRLENNFVNQPNLSEYYFFKRSGQFLYQLGKQQVGLSPLLTSVNLTGLQFGYTNLPSDKINTNSSANEILPRRSQPIQTFRGTVPPASFVQLRIGGVVVAQQQAGLSGEYEFLDVNLPNGQSNSIELLIFDRNNLSLPKEIRSLRLNSSDLLLPSGGNVQLGGLGVTGNYLQDSLISAVNPTTSGEFTAFYQIRQGLSKNLTLEGAVAVLPNTTQGQAGFVWRLFNPLILSSSVGTSRDKVGYTTDLDFQLDRLQIIGNAEFYPQGYFSNILSSNNRVGDRYNRSLETKYKFSDYFNLGFIARSQQNQGNVNASEYILPTFSLRPTTTLAFSGRPDILGNYLFSAFYQPFAKTRVSFNTFGDTYTTDLTYNLNREFITSFGTESGGNLATRYTFTINRSAPNLSGLSWRLGVGYREGEIGAIAGASMRLIPGLFATVDYQGIPSRYKSIYGGLGDDRLTVSLVSDLSFAGGRVSPSEYTALGKERGGIAGRLMVEGSRKSFNLGEATIRVLDRQGQTVGGAQTDAQGNFFVGNLREGVYLVQLDPEQLPVEISLRKNSVVAEVGTAAVTKLDFPVKVEYGLAGKVTDANGQAIPELAIEIINAEGKKVSTAITDEFGLYRLDAVPIGKYTIQVSAQESIPANIQLPKREVTIDGEFVYDQNLQLPINPTIKPIP